MKTPISTSTGAVATSGTNDNSGLKKAKGKNSSPVTMAVKPVLPPSSTPAALSMYVVPLDVPNRPDSVVARASTNMARPTFLGCPVSGVDEAADLRDPDEGGKAVEQVGKVNAKIGRAMPHVKAPITSNWNSTSVLGSENQRSGTVAKASPPRRCSTPLAIKANSDVPTMPQINAPWMRRITSQPVTSKPTTKTIRSAFIPPKRTIVTGSAATKPTFCSPMNARNSPMPAATPYRTGAGIASTIRSRMRKTDSSRKTIPETKTAPSAVCQRTPIPRTIP
jgi:hypothetical protein